MSTAKLPREATLIDAVTELERAAIAPPVPGELCGWIEEIVERALEVEPVLKVRCERDYARLLEEMKRLDSDLGSRIATLEGESASLSEAHRRVIHQAQTVLTTCRDSNRDEAHLAEACDDLKRAVVDVVLRIRTHEAALSTWHSEAVNRDRGPVD